MRGAFRDSFMISECFYVRAKEIYALILEREISYVYTSLTSYPISLPLLSRNILYNPKSRATGVPSTCPLLFRATCRLGIRTGRVLS